MPPTIGEAAQPPAYASRDGFRIAQLEKASNAKLGGDSGDALKAPRVGIGQQ